jgi:CHAT domain-containing protein
MQIGWFFPLATLQQREVRRAWKTCPASPRLFYAGSRALLVTHWEIESDAAVKLTTGAFSAMENDPRLSQAEAIRITMAALARDQSIGFAAHPSTWAAFALVGDGGRK